MEQNERVVAAVAAISSMVNTYGTDPKEFIELMSREHRTLQQSFSRLVWHWIEFVASDEYRTDGRNQASQDVAQRVLRAFRESLEDEEGYTGSTLDLMSKPSGYHFMI